LVVVSAPISVEVRPSAWPVVSPMITLRERPLTALFENPVICVLTSASNVFVVNALICVPLSAAICVVCSAWTSVVDRACIVVVVREEICAADNEPMNDTIFCSPRGALFASRIGAKRPMLCRRRKTTVRQQTTNGEA
jgi:hypothetical protein